MLTRSKAATEKAAAAATSAPTPHAAGVVLANGGGRTAAPAATSGGAERAEAETKGNSAGRAGPSESLVTLAAPVARIGRKRPADAASPPAAASALVSATNLPSETSTDGAKRRQLTRRSLPAASAGVEENGGESMGVTEAAASSGARRPDGTEEAMTDVSAAWAARVDSKDPSAGFASSTAGSSSPAASSASAVSSPDSHPFSDPFSDLFDLCRRLHAEGLSLWEVALHSIQVEVADLMAAHQAQLREAEAAAQNNPAAAAQLQAIQNAGQTRFDRFAQSSASLVSVIASTRNSMTRLRSVSDDMALLGYMCAVTNVPLSDEMRTWMLRVDALFMQIAERVPRVTLTPAECRSLLFTAAAAHAQQLLPALMKQPNLLGGCVDVPLLPFCRSPVTHWVSRLPYLRLFHYGLDPAQPSLDERDGPLSALQLARDFVREHPPALESSVMATGAAIELHDVGSIPSILAALVAQRQEPTWEAENLRRDALHAQFMHALLPAWRAHSAKVIALLSTPSLLIPDLAVIVGRHLDLEGLPVDRGSEEQNEAEAESMQ